MCCTKLVPLARGAGAAGNTEQTDDTDPEGGNDRGQMEERVPVQEHGRMHDIKLKGAAEGTR